MTSQLDNLCGPTGDLVHHAPDEKEVSGLVEGGLIRLTDARKPGLSLLGKFDLAYNAAFSLSLAALRRLGYRPKNKRFIVFPALQHTLDLGPGVWRVLKKCHDMRNKNVYRGAPDITEELVRNLLESCQTVADTISELHPVHKNDNNSPVTDENDDGGIPKPP